MKNILPKSALISLSDKTNLDLLVSFLLERNVEINSTGGTYKAIKKITNNVMEVSEYTGHKEMMGGRVKTLHPKIYFWMECFNSCLLYTSPSPRDRG